MIGNNFGNDFTYLYHALKAHPMLLKSCKLEEFDLLYEKLQNQITDYNTLIDAMTMLTMFFEDGHTNIELPYTKEDACLRISCEWNGEFLVLKEDYEEIKAGAKIIAVEGMKINGLHDHMAKLIPHENCYLVKSRMVEYPYKNYHVFSQMNLCKLFGNKQIYEITFCFKEAYFVKSCELVPYDGFLDFGQEKVFDYHIQESTLIFQLNECVYNDQYKAMLYEIAECCQRNAIDILEIDLSRNMGGSSAVIDEFLKYVDIDSYRRYEMIDYSLGSPRYITRRTDLIQNKKRDIHFPAKIFCRVSNTTFSSARTFAVTLKDNGIATIIGKPTGGKPNSYGMPRRDTTPILGIRFRVSQALFLRPDMKLDDEMSLYPDNDTMEKRK